MKFLFTYIKPNEHEALLARNIAAFPSAFQQRLTRFRRSKDAQATLLGRLLLREGLKKHYQKELNFEDVAYSTYGKPYLKNSNIHFNISHSEDIIVCVFDENKEVGIDVEYMKPIKIEDFKTQMTPNEWKIITEKENDLLAFYDYWTSKEAILKVIGQGLSLGLKTFEVDKSRAFALVKDQKWHLKECFLDEEYKCYVASKHAFEASPVLLRLDF